MSVLVRVLKATLPLAVLGLAGLVAVVMIRSQPDVETQPPPIAPPGVRVHQIELDSVQTSVTSQGTVRPRTETQIVPEVAGRVIWVSRSFASGGFFEQGDVLLRIERFDYEQAMVSARSQLAQARLRMAQEEAEAEVAQREWEALGVGDPRELTLRKPQLEEARASVAAAEANLVRSERDLERADITAPYAGRVRTKNVDIGQFVTVGTAIATIYGVDVAEIRLPLPDEELAYLNLPLAYRGSGDRVGPRVLVRTNFAGSTYEWRGRIVRTESEIDPVSRMVHIIAEVEDPYASGPDPNRPPLAVGMYVEAEIEGRTFNEIAVVPRAALRGRNQVLVIDADSRVRFREVDILRTTTESVYLRQGLSNGDRVAVSAVDNPTEGMLVQVTDVGVAPPTELAEADGSVSGSQAESAPSKAPDVAQPGWLRELLSESQGHEVRAPTPPAPLPTPTSKELTGPSGNVGAPGDSAPRAVLDTILRESQERTVSVQAFSTVSQMPGDAVLAEAIVSAITDRLRNLPSVTVVTSEDDATWTISGGIERIATSGVRVTARLVDVGQGAVVRVITVDGGIDELGQLQAEVATELSDTVREVTS